VAIGKISLIAVVSGFQPDANLRFRIEHKAFLSLWIIYFPNKRTVLRYCGNLGFVTGGQEANESIQDGLPFGGSNRALMDIGRWRNEMRRRPDRR
jgi:hypothetical protein